MKRAGSGRGAVSAFFFFSGGRKKGDLDKLPLLGKNGTGDGKEGLSRTLFLRRRQCFFAWCRKIFTAPQFPIFFSLINCAIKEPPYFLSRCSPLPTLDDDNRAAKLSRKKRAHHHGLP